MPKSLAEKRIGETRLMNCGMKATIISYKNAENIDVQFEDNEVLKWRSYQSFKRGEIRHPKVHTKRTKKDRTGETMIMRNGCKATIIRYGSCNDIDVKFDDGKDTIVKNWSYTRFKMGAIPYGRSESFKGTERLGETNIMRCGVSAKIISYISADNITILFDDGISVKTNYSAFNLGKVGHPTISLQKKGIGKFSTFDLSGIDHRLKKSDDIYYNCTCRNCKYKGVLTPTEMLEHKCLD